MCLVLAVGAITIGLGCAGDQPGTTQSVSSQTTNPGVASTTTTTMTEASGTTGAGIPSTSGAVSSSTTAVSLLSSSEKDLGNGRVRAGGFLRRAWEQAGERHLQIDYADFLTGQEAQQAAAEVGEEVTNDYFIRNKSAALRSFVVAPTATIKVARTDPADPPGTTWAAVVEAVQTNHWPVYWWIEREGMAVVAIEGVYTP